MASGKTVEMNEAHKLTMLVVHERNRLSPRETRPRDRSLPGKARRKQRKAA